ncbi:MAG: cupin-like domain-containing protein [Acidobacteriaceae bacterium]|nr:cupin-like domain-containing protein [Acidobacteriaceae bacterium]
MASISMDTQTASIADRRTGGLLQAAAGSNVRGQFDRIPFSLHHSLHSHPLFRLPALMELAQELKQNIYYDIGDAHIDDRWDSMPDRPQTAPEALKSIESGKTWLVIKNAQQSRAYGSVLDNCLAEAEMLVGENFREKVLGQEMIIFVTSPRRIATYHIDRECSFLLQVEGEKTIHIFDRNDRDVLTEEEIEAFWTVDNNAPRYRPQYQERAQSYLLRPGVAVHIPVNCPHWVENHDNVSISVNINVQFEDAIRADIYRANYFLRKFGFRPLPPGHSQGGDRVKARLYSAIRKGTRVCGKRLP